MISPAIEIRTARCHESKREPGGAVQVSAVSTIALCSNAGLSMNGIKEHEKSKNYKRRMV
jgi:hypothetical protein